jgi:hypothetical protein
LANRSGNVIIQRCLEPGAQSENRSIGLTFLQSTGENIMPEENAPETQQEEKTMPSVRKQIAVMAIIVVGITIVLGGGVMLSTWLK